VRIRNAADDALAYLVSRPHSEGGRVAVKAALGLVAVMPA